MNVVAFLLGFAAVLVGFWLAFVGPYSHPAGVRAFVGWFACGAAAAVVLAFAFALVLAHVWPRD